MGQVAAQTISDQVITRPARAQRLVLEQVIHNLGPAGDILAVHEGRYFFMLAVSHAGKLLLLLH